MEENKIQQPFTPNKIELRTLDRQVEVRRSITKSSEEEKEHPTHLF